MENCSFFFLFRLNLFKNGIYPESQSHSLSDFKNQITFCSTLLSSSKLAPWYHFVINTPLGRPNPVPAPTSLFLAWLRRRQKSSVFI